MNLLSLISFIWKLLTVHNKFHVVESITYNSKLVLPKGGTIENEKLETCIKLANFKFCQKVPIKILKIITLSVKNGLSSCNFLDKGNYRDFSYINKPAIFHCKVEKFNSRKCLFFID